jgi:hypothetical protein
MTRLTNDHGKKWDNHPTALALCLAYYNYRRDEADDGPKWKVTPAMASELIDHVWGVAVLLEGIGGQGSRIWGREGLTVVAPTPPTEGEKMQYEGKCDKKYETVVSKVVLVDNDLRIYFTDNIGMGTFRGCSEDGIHFQGICEYRPDEYDVTAKFDLHRGEDGRIELDGSFEQKIDNVSHVKPWVIVLKPIPGTEGAKIDD